MNRPTILFAGASICLLILAFVTDRIGAEAGSLVFNFRNKGYGFSPASIFVFMAALSCMFAAVYSFWIVPMNQKAATWHFWLTAIGFSLFWIFYYTFSAIAKGDAARRSGPIVAAMAITGLASFLLIMVAQGVFVTNLISGIAQLRQRG